MQVHPSLNIIAIPPAKSFLSRLQVRVACIPPSALRDKRIPNLDLFFAGFSAAFKTPIENVLVRSPLKGSGDQLIIIHSEKSCAARIEKGWIFHAAKIAGRQTPRGV